MVKFRNCLNSFKHSHKKQKDSLETLAVLLIFSLELEISGVVVQSIHQNSVNGDFREELLSEKDFETVLATSCCYGLSAWLLRQFRRSLQIKKSIANAPRVLLFAE